MSWIRLCTSGRFPLQPLVSAFHRTTKSQQALWVTGINEVPPLYHTILQESDVSSTRARDESRPDLHDYCTTSCRYRWHPQMLHIRMQPEVKIQRNKLKMGECHAEGKTALWKSRSFYVKPMREIFKFCDVVCKLDKQVLLQNNEETRFPTAPRNASPTDFSHFLHLFLILRHSILN